jgi:phosphoglycerol transferase MdoB-like AlkP superfamily enzyme
LKHSNHAKRTPRRLLSLPASLGAAVLLSGFYTLLCLWIQPNSLRSVLSVFRGQPLLIVLNALPIGLLLLAFAFLFRNVFSAAALVGTCCALLSVANRIKIEVRDEPVFPRDFALLKEVGSAVGTYSIRWPWAVLAVILLCMIACLAAARLVGCKPVPGQWKGRAAGFAVSLGTLIALIFTVYASGSLYGSFQTSNAYYVPSVFNELGFPYCFCRHFTTYAVDKPEGYHRETAEQWEQSPTGGTPREVSVIMVMNEAFSDLTDASMFTYPAERDPLANFHALSQDAYCISGHVVVPGFAGGTANTEFDVLTGMQTNALSASTTSALRAVNRNLDSLFRIFGADGYATSFVHPGDDWFYNRENVYRWLGAQESLFVDEMEQPEYKGRWVTDDYLAGLIEQRFETTVSQGDPMFSYITTIQNHMSYTADKYGANGSFPPVETSADLSDSVRTMLSVYVEGVRDADAMLGRLADYFSARQEPVVLVYFGDHLPDLGNQQLGYTELGMGLTPDTPGSDSYLRAYETPYLIWGNAAAGEALDWSETVASMALPQDGRISACYLGASILELTGRKDANPWFQYLTEVRQALPVIQSNTCVRPDGSIVQTEQLSQEEQTLIAKLRQWSYYKLKYKDVD